MAKNKLILFLMAISFVFPLLLKAQSPAFDPNWTLDTAHSDEFKPTTGTHSQNGIFTTKWQLLQSGVPPAFDWGGASAFNPAYDSAKTISGNGYLRLKVDSLRNGSSGTWSCKSACEPNPYTPGNCNFNTGGVASVHRYSYGYFEISAELPGYTSVTGDTGYGAKFWPAFWMDSTKCHGDTAYHNEIDIMDECCCAYSDCKTSGSGWSNYYAYDSTSSCSGKGIAHGTGATTGPESWYTIVSPTPLCSKFHTYGVEWNTNRLVFYRDSVPYVSFLNNDSLAMDPQQVVIDLQLTCWCLFDQNTFHYDDSLARFQFMQVDYFHYYQLKHAGTNCSTAVTFTDNSDVNLWSAGVASSFTFGNGTNSINLGSCSPPAGYDFVFRAVNYFKINNGGGQTFTIPNSSAHPGTPVMFVPTNCN